MGTFPLSMLFLFLQMKGLQCCRPGRPGRPGGAGNNPSTPQPGETTTTTAVSGSQNNTENETASTNFNVKHSNSFFACTFDFTFNVDKSVNIMHPTSSGCAKSSDDGAALGFLEEHQFKVVSKNDVEISCSLAAVFITKDDAIELVDNVIEESIKCSVTPGTCLTEDGPNFYSKCSVPYIFNDRMYQACTDWPQTEGGAKESRLWCATRTNTNLVMDEGHWGWCSSSCGYCGGADVDVPTTTTSSEKTTTTAPAKFTCETEKGKECVFPFVDDGGQTYTECADWKSKYHWCATSVNADLTYKTWEKCVMSSCGAEGLEGANSDCKTVGSPNSGALCVFPFKDGGTTHNTCTLWKGKQWCATSLNADGSYKGYGYCDEDICPLELRKGGRLGHPQARSVEKCGYDCLVNTDKTMVSSPPVSNEKLIGPTAIFEKNSLSDPSFNIVSNNDTMFQFIRNQKGIDLKCKMGQFSDFVGESSISVVCTGDGIFTVTGQASRRIWENVKNTQFGCNPCPGYKSLTGNMKETNTIATYHLVTSIIGCLYLCEVSEKGCGVIQYSLDDQRCTLYTELDLANDGKIGEDLICQDLSCDSGGDLTRGFPTIYRFLVMAFQSKKNTGRLIYDIKNQSPIAARVIVKGLSPTPLLAQRSNFVKGIGSFHYFFLDEEGTKIVNPIKGDGNLAFCKWISPTNVFQRNGENIVRGHLIPWRLWARMIFEEDTLKTWGMNMVNIFAQDETDNGPSGKWFELEKQSVEFIEREDEKGNTVTLSYIVEPGTVNVGETGVKRPKGVAVFMDSTSPTGQLKDCFRFYITNPKHGEKAEFVMLDKKESLNAWTINLLMDSLANDDVARILGVWDHK